VSALESIEGGAVSAVKVGAGLLTHWQALAFAGLALVSGLGIGALYFYDKGYTSASVTYERTIAVANDKAKADHDAQQSKLDALAKATNPELAKKFDRISQQLSSLGIEAKHPPKVFVPECVMPDEQVAAYNGIGK
jgi:hypothetical protein